MKKKLLAVALTFAIFACLLTGCDHYKYKQDLNIVDDLYDNYYEVFVYSFYDSDGDGIGDLDGVTEKLDYIEDMGFTGIWLMPVLQSPSYHKYDVSDYMTIDKQYGDNEAMKNLINECHERGINVIMDFVMNHTSSSHPWFVEACAYLRGLGADEEPNAKDCPYVDYYHFSEKKENKDYYPVNGTRFYYEGVFWSEMPDLNWDNEAVMKEYQDIAKYWLDMGLDGLRMDATTHFKENDVDYNNHVLNEFYTYCQSVNPNFYMVCEAWTSQDKIADYYKSNINSFFNFPASQAEGCLMKAARGNYSADKLMDNFISYEETYGANSTNYIDAPFLSNHDNIRVSNSLADNVEAMKLAGGLLLSMSGNPFVYYGEEIGLPSAGTKDENKRIPMLWSSEEDVDGACDGPSAMDADITSTFEGVEEQLKDENSILNYYKRALRIRNENPEIARGEMAKVDALCSDKQAAITKTYDGSTIAIIYNLDENEAEMNLSKTELSKMKIRGYLTVNGEEVTLKDGKLQMPAKSICIMK